MGHSKRRLRRSTRRRILIVSVFVLLIAFVLLLKFSSSLFYTVSEDVRTGKTIIHDDITYYPRQDITTLLILAVDRTENPLKPVGNNTTAEAAALLIFDDTTEEINIITFHRDTMATVSTLDEKGKQTGTVSTQLALAHSYGDGWSASAENTVKALSGFMFGAPVDYYISVDINALPALNDAVDGVQVTIRDDFTSVDPDMQMGDMLLMGDQSITYLQLQRDGKIPLNTSLPGRQRDYINGFLKALEKSINNNDFQVAKLRNKIKSDVVSDCSNKILFAMINRFAIYSLQEIFIPEGKDVSNSGVNEHYVDEEQLKVLVLDLMYSPK